MHIKCQTSSLDAGKKYTAKQKKGNRIVSNIRKTKLIVVESCVLHCCGFFFDLCAEQEKLGWNLKALFKVPC